MRAADETIVALSSGALPAGIAVLRLSGSGAGLGLETVAGPLPSARRASLRRIRDARGSTIDHGLVLFFPGPASVTGEDLAEIHLHGGRAVVAAAIDALLQVPGLRLAEAGEFTRRAFDNGRIDLTEAEGLAALLTAETDAQRRQAVEQSGGGLRRLYEDWMRRLTDTRALLEASFDFADEGDVGDGIAGAVRPTVRALADEMRALLTGARRGEILRHGFKVVIAGPPNAGKSSLLNALADREVAIVSDRPGTTRDVLDVTLDLGGFPVRISDTAGLRRAEDEIEAIGIARAEAAMANADLVVLLRAVGDASKPTHVKRPLPVLSVVSKVDLMTKGHAEPGGLAISARTGQGLEELVRAIASAASKAVGNPSDLVPTRSRHIDLIRQAEAFLRAAGGRDLPDEMMADHLRLASDRLGSLTGRIGIEDLLDVIFSEFCIGK